MHYIGMFAYHSSGAIPSMTGPQCLWSLLAAVLASTIALFVVQPEQH